MPPSQLIFQVTPLNGRQWVAVLQISLPVILLDEALKYLSRTHVDGEWRPQTPPLAFLQPASPPASTPSLQWVSAALCAAGARALGSAGGRREPCSGLDHFTLLACCQPCPVRPAVPSSGSSPLTSLS